MLTVIFIVSVQDNYRFLFAVYTETISALLIIHIHCTVFLLLTREEATFR